MFPAIEQLLHKFSEEAHLIIPERKVTLGRLADYLREHENEAVKLNFICTHNSRRSHFAQVWAEVVAVHFGMSDIHTFSGGTEATAFNSRAVAALERAGFQVVNPGGHNPPYQVFFLENTQPMICFSKTFDDPINPTENFAAIMTCSAADENCPFIPGVNFRLRLTYEDPKTADDTAAEAHRYDERFLQIGRELFYAFQLAAR